jgi:hypothetical protein
MSKQYPECPLYNHDNCKQFHNPKVCAVIRNDNNCLRKRYKNSKETNRSISCPEQKLS